MSKSKSKLHSKSKEGKDSEDDDHKKSEFPFLILSQAKCEELLKMTVTEMESELANSFKLQPATDLKDASVLDYHVGAAYWAKQQGYNAKQFAGFFSISYQLLQKIKDEKCSMVDLFKAYHKKLAGIGTEEKNNGEMDFFSIDQAKNITDYLHSSIFQHYKLYSFLFSRPQLEEILCCDLSLETPLPAKTPYPPPLDEGLLESVYKEFLVLPISSSAEQTDSDASKSTTKTEVNLPEDVEDLFAKLSPEDVRMIIQEVSSEVLYSLQSNVENKIKTQETTVLSKINKIKVVPLDESAPTGNV
ncbi:hypothetical protein Btru_060742 [Bulinus truncatus]|nr:hypothetical protein Btru_060742 [Bulinus truncatus]